MRFGKQHFWVIQFVFLALLGGGLLFLSFRKIELGDLIAVIASGNFLMILPVFLVSLLVYLIRVRRWQLLFRGIGVQAPGNYLFASLATGYLVNFAVPRLGEISRAIILKRWLQYPINNALSTVIVERITDVLCLVIILLASFGLEIGNPNSLLRHFVPDFSFVTRVNWLVILAVLIALAVVYKIPSKRISSIGSWLRSLLTNMQQVAQMPNKTVFIFYTMAIWVGYFLMTYLWIFYFPESSGLSIYNAFLVTVLGVLARSLPIQAGSAGAYHFVVSQALLLTGIDLVTGNALAVVIHGFQTVLTLTFGAGAYLWLLTQERKRERESIKITDSETFN